MDLTLSIPFMLLVILAIFGAYEVVDMDSKLEASIPASSNRTTDPGSGGFLSKSLYKKRKLKNVKYQ